jgi:photosystem II stability/assembly factor-like uncharacterized protein
MPKPAFILIFLFLAFPPAWPQWRQQPSGTDVPLRGISAVSERVAWASGAKGTVLRTLDGGETWTKISVPDAEALDFRDIQAFDQNTAFILSIGPGEQSRIYKTTNGGRSWIRQFTNKDPKAFYDCFAFWDSKHGIAMSDSVNGKFPLLITSDGSTWTPLAPEQMPAALPSEGAFAASGTCIATYGKNDVWFGTGGPAARVFHSRDGGKNWTVAETPLIHGVPSQGVFSVLFWSEKDGMVAGGDYQEPGKAERALAVTHDGGKSWVLASRQPGGYRSGVAMARPAGRVPNRANPSLVAVGTNGMDFSYDGGASWSSGPGQKPGAHEEGRAYNAVSCIRPACWAVGPAGRIEKTPKPLPVIEN